MRACKVDNNMAVVVQGLRRMGFSVADLSKCGKGIPDLLAGKHGKNYLIEVKNGKAGKLTGAQVMFHKTWQGEIFVIRSLEDLEKIG